MDTIIFESEAYLDWFNNFLTVERFAEYYGISEDYAYDLIQRGRVGMSENRAFVKYQIYNEA